MSRLNRLLVLAVVTVVLIWPLAGAVVASDGTGGHGALSKLSAGTDDGDVDTAASDQFEGTVLNVSYDDALATAKAQLARSDGYHLTDVKVKSNTYEFEFAYWNGTEVGEAEIEVSAETGAVLANEQTYESSDDPETDIAISVVSDTPAPGEEVTANLTLGGNPLAGVDVMLNGETVGQTDADGTITFELANGSKSKISVEDGEAEGELEFEFEPEDDEVPDDALGVDVVSGTPEPGETITLGVTLGNESVEGATVHVNDQPIGVTDENGTVAVTLPDDEDVDIEVEYLDADGEIEFEFEGNDDDDRDDDDDDGDDGDDDDDDDDEGDDDSGDDDDGDDDDSDDNEGDDDGDDEDEDDGDGDDGDGDDEKS